MTFLPTFTVAKGDPDQTKKIHEFYETISFATRFEWQYRVAMAFRESPRHQCAWVTLTYGTPAYGYKGEPASWITARRDIKKWQSQIRDYNNRVCVPAHHQHLAELKANGKLPDPLPPGLQYNSDETLKYIIVEEEGSKFGRKHFHALVWFPYHVGIDRWKENLLLF